MHRLLAIVAFTSACTVAPVGSFELASTVALTVLHSFDGDADGAQTRAGLSLGPDGKLWGATWQRGPNATNPPDGHSCNSTSWFDTDYQKKMCPGTVFRVNADGTGFEVVHAFTPLDGYLRNADGYQPTAAPVHGLDGWMYGTTTKGGRPSIGATVGGRGVIYRINAFTLEFQTVYSLGSVTPNAKDGANPYGGLALDELGHAYLHAKNFGQYPNASGALLRLDLATLAVGVIHGYGRVNYAAEPDVNVDGGNPYASPVLGRDGMLHAWMPALGPLGGGTIAVIDPAAAWDAPATVTRALTRSDPVINTDNAALASLTVLDDRILGMRPYQGANGAGEIFALDPDGTNYRPIYSFDAAPVTTPGVGHYVNATGAAPLGTLVEDCDGSLVGTTFYGGGAGTGVVYRIRPDGSGQTVLYEFPPASSGGAPRYPSSGLIKLGDSWYGTTQSGGEYGPGTIYRLEVNP